MNRSLLDILLRPLMLISIRWQLIILTVPLLAAIVLFQYNYFPEEQAKASRIALEVRATELSKVLAKNALPFLAMDDEETAADILKGAADDPDILYALIMNTEGKRFAALNPLSIPTLEAPKDLSVSRHEMVEKEIRAYTPMLLNKKVVGVLLLSFSTEAIETQREAYKRTSATLGLSVLSIGLAVLLLIGTLLVRPIAQATTVATRLSQGDLTEDVVQEAGRLLPKGGDVAHATELADTSRNEVVRLAASLMVAVDGMRKVMVSVSQNVEVLAAASRELTSAASAMNVGAEVNASRATVVSTAAEGVRDSISTVASGVNDFTARMRDIAGHVTEAAEVALSAVELAGSTRETVSTLGQSSAEIEQVIEMIGDIATQTNMLALNAGIQAARAGVEGRGFAVVAKEINSLASHSAQATADISSRIATMRSATDGATDAIAEISATIHSIHERQTLVTGAVADQDATTREIASSVADGARGSSEIATNIAAVAEAAQDVSAATGSVQASADDLADIADTLKDLVARYRF